MERSNTKPSKLPTPTEVQADSFFQLVGENGQPGQRSDASVVHEAIHDWPVGSVARVLPVALAFFSYMPVYSQAVTTGAILEAPGEIMVSCQAPPSGLRDIEASPFYIDSRSSIVDPVRAKNNNVLTEPFIKFLEHVIADADQYVLQNDINAGRCALDWMDRWAKDGAMLGKMIGENNGIEAANNRKAFATGFGIAYLKVSKLATQEQRQQIADWLLQLDKKNRQLMEAKHLKNNHLYWGAVESLTAGLASQDTDAIAFARSVYRQAIDDILDNGLQPLEMARGERALAYSNAALEYIIILAHLSQCIGENWGQYRPDRLALLANRILEGVRDPYWYNKQTGIMQRPLNPHNLGWVLIYPNPLPSFVKTEILSKRIDAHGEYHVGGNWQALAKICESMTK